MTYESELIRITKEAIARGEIIYAKIEAVYLDKHENTIVFDRWVGQ